MLIVNLDYLEPVQTDRCLGGVSANVSATTIATNGFSYADGNAVVSGQQTSTTTRISTKVAQTSFYSSSSAGAYVSASARTGDSQAKATIDRYNLYVSVSN